MPYNPEELASRISQTLDAITAAEGNPKYLKTMLIELALRNQEVTNYIMSTHEFVQERKKARDARDAARAIDFSTYYSRVWGKLTVDYGFDGEDGYSSVHDVLDEVLDAIIEIGKRGSIPGAPFETRRSALWNICDIAAAVVERGDDGEVLRKVRGRFSDDDCVEKAFGAVLNSMSREEKDKLGLLEDGRSLFVQKMRKLEGFGMESGCFTGLGDFVAALFGEVELSEEDEEDDDDSENSDSAADRYNRDVALGIH